MGPTVIVVDDDVRLRYLLRQLCKHQPKESRGYQSLRSCWSLTLEL